ncbi:cell division protein ZipA C-terminal FtsZ-binding domain-containing protein [Azonexus sp.]|jgi:hypothetical protein|uniref:cell division protein ZipA C-terminal FtsZ-binding domain-containing protein n=1 Tax=Azonexus sp. TaxID=1872668 RepID=UPI002827FDB9|nr:cell division protein ZipA C-terminal FtsZ-binding domain-containing protein [Azonexus sp.]MDR1996142.1 cell division protein ZipA C-terminal FtsZ-binding domain-containing protein [Azonexus sp.]
MTELQLGLIGLGTAAVVGVFAYNKWQERRHRKLAEKVLKPHHADVLLGGGQPAAAGRSEPEWPVGKATVGLAETERVDPILIEPVLTTPTSEFTPTAQPTSHSLRNEAPLRESAPNDEADDPPAGPVPAELLDPRLEFVVTMELVEPVSVGQILHSQHDVLQRLSKPVHWVGFNERSREWERLRADSEQPVRRLRIGLQLVNRQGPVSEADLVLFTGAMQVLADELMAVADMPPSRVLDQAAEVDRFCAAVDLEIGLNLVSSGLPFPGTKIRALAEAAGMALNVDGAFTRYDDAGRPQFSLQNYEATPFSADTLRNLTTHGLTFILDVPRVDHGERVFMQMTELARRFADTLHGTLVDDNRQPLSDSQLEHIRREFIGKPQATMASFGLPAGSSQARRLFS